MMTEIALAQRIDRLESRADLAELCSAYCMACDDRDMPRLASLFTQDIHIRSVDGAMNATGVADAIAMFNRMFGIRGPSYHWTHDRFVAFDPEDLDRATGVVLAHAETTPNGIVSIAALRYNDVYRREAGRWRFAERLLSFLYYMPMAEFIQHFRDDKRVAVQGDWRAGDYPEKLQSWRDWHWTHGAISGG